MATRREQQLRLQAQAAQRAQQQRNMNAAGGPRFGGFTPYQPPPIPSGFYDPNLDAQRNAASRGLLSTEQDLGTAGRRAGEDLEWAQADITRDRGYAEVDYGRNVEMLSRRYGEQARQQGEQARKYGVSSGGIALLSAAKRTENQGLERRDLDTTRDRVMAGFDTARDRTNELHERGVSDRGDQLSRARTEDQFYGLDIGEQKGYQATQAGYEAPTGPSNEFTTPGGVPYRVIMRGGRKIRVDQYGRPIARR